VTAPEFTALRKRLGLTQAEIGELIGKSARTVRAFEAGFRKIPRSAEIILTGTAIALALRAH